MSQKFSYSVGIGVLLLSLLWTTLAVAGEIRYIPQNPLEGRRVFINKGCIKCHAIWGEGGTIGPDLGKVGFGRNIFQLAGALWNHSPRMVEKMLERRLPRPTLSEQEMTDLIAFLSYLRYLDEPGDPQRGAQLFREKRCIVCHRVGEEGGTIGPPLDQLKRFVSPLLLAQTMWNHGPQMVFTMRMMNIPRPQFQGKEMVDILAYIRSVARGTAPQPEYIQPGNPVEGQKLFHKKGCDVCHAIQGVGGTRGPDLGKKQLHKSVTEVAGIMWNHAPQMEAEMQVRGLSFPKFSQQEMADLISYLYFIGYYDESADPVHGREVFVQKGCLNCHQVEGEGEAIGPDLSRSELLTSPIAFTAAMWNHASAMEQWIAERNLSWPVFEGNEMADLVRYLQTVQQKMSQQ
ncbi:MAG: hypothetical protein D6736_17200 [Nitrospinota bacterium]|nr:MAG: hypothetical protein D6736_17200 [Nitrospinota bacterium]